MTRSSAHGEEPLEVGKRIHENPRQNRAWRGKFRTQKQAQETNGVRGGVEPEPTRVRPHILLHKENGSLGFGVGPSEGGWIWAWVLHFILLLHLLLGFCVHSSTWKSLLR